MVDIRKLHVQEPYIKAGSFDQLKRFLAVFAFADHVMLLWIEDMRILYSR